MRLKVKTWHCNRQRKTAFESELDAKMALAERMHRDKGEVRIYPCPHSRPTHWHLTSQP